VQTVGDVPHFEISGHGPFQLPPGSSSQRSFGGRFPRMLPIAPPLSRQSWPRLPHPFPLALLKWDQSICPPAYRRAAVDRICTSVALRWRCVQTPAGALLFGRHGWGGEFSDLAYPARSDRPLYAPCSVSTKRRLRPSVRCMRRMASCPPRLSSGGTFQGSRTTRRPGVASG
jgi:hypothetical protein